MEARTDTDWDSSAHPNGSSLEDYLLGKLDEPAFDEIEEHIAGCATCLERLDKVESFDRVVSLLQSPGDTSPTSVDPGPKSLSQVAREHASPKIDRYEIVKEIGRGGMGVVYRAIDQELNRTVALKTLQPGGSERQEFRMRFHLEAKALARLHHPNIVQIFEVGESNGCLFVALEFVEGSSLDEYLDHHKLSPKAAAELTVRLAAAAHFAHQCGIVHRDLKPGNILINASGTPKIADFGLAKQLDSDVEHTRTGMLLGTPGYMAPEQAAGKQENHVAVDVYGLGAILYRCVTDRAPIQGDSWIEILHKLHHSSPPTPRSVRPEIPRDLETICLKCLARAPASRYASAAALADDLQRFLENRQVSARRLSTWMQIWRWAQRNPTIAAMIGFIIVSLCVGVITTTQLWLKAERARAGADLARDSLQDALTDVTDARDRANHNLYANQISNSWAQSQLGNLSNARALLEECEANPVLDRLRGWEWYFVRQMCDREMLLLAPYREMVAFAVAIDPRGTLVASGHGIMGSLKDPSGPAVVLLRETQTGDVLQKISDLRGRINALSFSPDGRMLAASCSDGSLRVWDRAEVSPDTLVQPDTPDQPKSDPTALFVERVRLDGLEKCSSAQFSQDGRYIGYISSDNASIVYDLVDDCVAINSSSEYRLTTMAFDMKSHWLAAVTAINGWKNQVLFSDLEENLVHKWVKTGGLLHFAIMSPHGDRLAVAGTNGLIAIIKPGKQPVILQANGDKARGLAFDPTGNLLASGSEDGGICIWNIGTQGVSAAFQGHDDPITGLCFSPDGSSLASSSIDGTVRMWDLTRPAMGGLIPYARGGVCDLAVRPDSNTLVLASPDLCQSIDVITGEVLHERVINTVATTPRWPRSDCRLSPDGGLLIIPPSPDHNSLRLYDTQSDDSPIEIFCLDGFLTAAAWSGDARWIAAAAKVDREGEAHTKLTLWNATYGTESPVSFPLLEDIVLAVCLNADGSRLAISHSNGKGVSLFDTATGRLLQRLTGPKESFGLAFHPNAPLLAAADSDSSLLFLWDTESMELVCPPLSAPTSISSVSFSHDGRRIAGVGQDANVQVWETATGNPLVSLGSLGGSIGTRGWTPRIAFSPDGRHLISQHLGGQAKVWSIARNAGGIYAERHQEQQQRLPFWHLAQGLQTDDEQTAAFHLQRLPTDHGMGGWYRQRNARLLRKLGFQEQAAALESEGVVQAALP